jgi:ribosome-binding factor A
MVALMNRRTDRAAKLIQETVGHIILERMNDPRIDPARVSVTRVEVAEDMMHAKVYCSVMGSEADQRKAMRALQHAAGRIQDLMTERVNLRFTPVLQFVSDVQFKRSLTTLALIQQAMEEIRQQEQSDAGAAVEKAEDDSADAD